MEFDSEFIPLNIQWESTLNNALVILWNPFIQNHFPLIEGTLEIILNKSFSTYERNPKTFVRVEFSVNFQKENNDILNVSYNPSYNWFLTCDFPDIFIW